MWPKRQSCRYSMVFSCILVWATKATWDPIAVQDFAVAVGQEFRGKGANVILGPGVQVQRVARNGRSFEYFAGTEQDLWYRGWSMWVTGTKYY